VSYRSNQTFLYPLMLGDGNPSLALQKSGMTWVRALAMQARAFVEIVPVRLLPFFAIAALLQRERDQRKPLLALVGASFFGLALITHTFSQSDPGNVARYCYAFM